MPVSWWCVLIGLVLSVCGGVLGLRGFLSTFRTYSPDGQLLGNIRERLKAAWAWLSLLMRSPSGTSDSATATEREHVRPSLPPINTAESPSMFVRELQDQVAGLDYQRGIHISVLDEKIRSVALDGIRLQAIGLLLTVVGALFMGIPTLVSSDQQETVCVSTGRGQLRCTVP
ncbi:hypothetical protein [Streptomyces hydrogenans]